MDVDALSYVIDVQFVLAQVLKEQILRHDGEVREDNDKVSGIVAIFPVSPHWRESDRTRWILSLCVFMSCWLPASPAVRVYSCFLPYRDWPSLTTLKYGISSGCEPLHVDCISVEIHGIKTFPSLCLPRLCTVIVFQAHQLLENPILHLEMMIFCAGFCTDSLQIMKHWSDRMKLIPAPFPLRVSIIDFFSSDPGWKFCLICLFSHLFLCGCSCILFFSMCICCARDGLSLCPLGGHLV